MVAHDCAISRIAFETSAQQKVLIRRTSMCCKQTNQQMHMEFRIAFHSVHASHTNIWTFPIDAVNE